MRGFVAASAKVPLIAAHDIGEAAAEAFTAPARWRDATVELAADFRSGAETAQALAALRHERVTYACWPALAMKLFAREMWKMRRGIEVVGLPPFPLSSKLAEAMESTKRLVPRPWKLEDFLETAGWATREL